MLAVIVPSLLPPPLPFKIFVLSAGAFQIPWSRFLLAVGIGRSIRYFSEGILAVLYGKQAIKLVADNFAVAGVLLAALIVAATLVFVYTRRRKVRAGIVLMPLILALLGPACTSKTVPMNQRMLPWTALPRDQALAKLESMAAISSMEAGISLSGSTPLLKEKDKRAITPFSLSGTIFLTRSNQIALMAGIPFQRMFEIVSDGTNYEVFINGSEELYTGGLEEGPPSKPIPTLGDLANQFVGMKPRRIHESLMPKVDHLLRNPAVRVVTAEEILERKHFLVASFVDFSSNPEPRLLQRIWFDLTTPTADIVRRQTYIGNGKIDTETRYSDHEAVNDTLRYPAKVEIHLYETDTTIEIALDPEDSKFNAGIEPDKFKFPTEKYRDAKTLRFEPRDPGTVSQQR
jgi:hypothetical protein